MFRIDVAADMGTRHLVKLGAKGAQLGSSVAFWDAHARIEQHLRDSGVPSVVLRPSTYATNLLAGAETIRAMGRLFAPAADAKIAMIDPRDVAAVAAVVLTRGWARGTYVHHHRR